LAGIRQGAAVTAAPRITAITPFSGSPGESFTIEGRSLSDATAVLVGGTQAPFTVSGRRRLVATVPDGAESGPVSVSTPSGTFTSGASFVVNEPGAQSARQEAAPLS
jgi:hypothetical protein